MQSQFKMQNSECKVRPVRLYVHFAFCILNFAFPAACAVAGETAAAPAALKDAPVNTWVKVLEMKTGARVQPLFVYAANIKKFILATGMQTYGGIAPRHYDTEEFDLATCKWINAYPAALAAGRPESGPVGEEYSKARVMQGNSGPVLFYKDGDFLRLGAGGQWLGTATTYDWCYVPDNGKVYASMWDKTLCYDVAARTWQDLQAKPREKCRVWGSLCYDAGLKLVLLNNSSAYKVWALKFDRKTARMAEITE